MEETYTFSRALHLMRYSGKNMKPITWVSDCYVYVNKDGFLAKACSDYEIVTSFTSNEIMGSWVEVKE